MNTSYLTIATVRLEQYKVEFAMGTNFNTINFKVKWEARVTGRASFLP